MLGSFRRPVALGAVLAFAMLLAVGGASVHAQTATTIAMKDFVFEGLPTQLTPGQYTFNVTNQGQQEHVLVMLELQAGKTLQDVLSILPTLGPDSALPPGLFVDGPPTADAFAPPGQSASASFTVRPGNYVAVCPIPDPASGKLHADLGMANLIRVREGAPAGLPDTGAASELTALLAAIAMGGLVVGYATRRRARAA